MALWVPLWLTVLQVNNFLTYPVNSVHPMPFVPHSNVLLPSGYAALQGLLILCAGSQACRWTQNDVQLRVEEWKRRLDQVIKTSHSYLTQEEWQEMATGDAYLF